MQDFYMAIGALGVHAIFKDLIDPDKAFQRSLAVEELLADGIDPRGLHELPLAVAEGVTPEGGAPGGSGAEGAAGSGAPAEGSSPRPAEVLPTMDSVVPGVNEQSALVGGGGGGGQSEQKVGVKSRGCTIL
eukprot:SAG22_NODE_1650_length_3897_cov_2.043181_1_plen_131_part_00